MWIVMDVLPIWFDEPAWYTCPARGMVRRLVARPGSTAHGFRRARTFGNLPQSATFRRRRKIRKPGKEGREKEFGGSWVA